MKIFVLLSRIPYPLEKGDKLRAFHQIKRLAINNEIILCCLNDAKVDQNSIEELEKHCKHIHIINLSRPSILYQVLKAVSSVNPFQVHYFYSRYAQLKINALLEHHKPDRIFCQLIRTSEYVRYVTHIPKILDYMDILSKGIERRIAKVNFLFKPVFRLEYQRLRRYERKIFDYFDKTIIISQQDKDLIAHPFKEKVFVVPNGVDMSFFKPYVLEFTSDLLFTGNMSYPPNVDSAVYLAEKVLPLVQKKYPNIKLTIAGHNPAPQVKRLANKHIVVTGWVEDIRKSYASAKIFIAPMNIGTGLQNKLLEAMIMQRPCITSALANNALGATDKKEILIGASPQEYAELIIFLLENPDKAAEIAKNGYDFVNQNFDWDNNCRILENIICS